MISINGKTEADYRADFIHWECSAPEPKQETADVPLRDGFIDLTKMLSEVPYFGPRTLTIGLELRSLRGMWPLYYSKLLEDFHGQEVKVIRSDDPNYYWIGTAAVGELDEHGGSAGVTITVNAQPFKRTVTEYKLDEITMTGDKSIEIDVREMRGYPIFETSTTGFTVTFDGETWTLPAGKSEANGLILLSGVSELALHGAGKIKISWRGGTL